MSHLDNTQRIVRSALSWVGTPYHHQQRLKGVGVDCAHLIAGIAIECNLISADSILPMDYSPEWNMHNREELLLGYLADFGCTEKTSLDPGDIICFTIGQAVGHIGIYVGDMKYVHAQNMTMPRQVTINTLSGRWQKRHSHTFAFPRSITI